MRQKRYFEHVFKGLSGLDAPWLFDKGQKRWESMLTTSKKGYAWFSAITNVRNQASALHNRQKRHFYSVI